MPWRLVRLPSVMPDSGPLAEQGDFALAPRQVAREQHATGIAQRQPQHVGWQPFVPVTDECVWQRVACDHAGALSLRQLSAQCLQPEHVGHVGFHLHHAGQRPHAVVEPQRGLPVGGQAVAVVDQQKLQLGR